MSLMVRDKTKKDPYMCATLLNMFSRGDLRKNHPLQRKANKWKTDARDGFIVTTIKHEDVDSIKICEQIDNDTVKLWLIDGLQRLTTLEKYKKGIFKLGKSLEMPFVYYQVSLLDEEGNVICDEYGEPTKKDVEYDLRGKGYNDLPEELKEKFDNFSIDVVKHLDCTDEEIGYHIRRYNRQTSMNNNENSITYMDSIAKKIKIISQNHSFFKECGSYTAIEKQNGTCERIICETLMAAFHINDWQKNSKKMGAFLNHNATDDEFTKLSNALSQLEAIVNDDFKNIFTSKDSFIFITLFLKFLNYGVENIKFAEFLKAFSDELIYKKVIEEDNLSFADMNVNRATKDKTVIVRKLNILEKLMKDFLHIHNEIGFSQNDSLLDKKESILEFIKENVKSDAIEDDINFYRDILEDYIKITSPLMAEENLPSMLALVAFGCENDLDKEVEEWLPKYESQNTKYIGNQKDNFDVMRNSFMKYIKKCVA